MNSPLSNTLICFSHLRWDFVYQRPQHLLSRFARHCEVYYMEEPIFLHEIVPGLAIKQKLDHLWVCTPQLPIGLSADEINIHLQIILDEFLTGLDTRDYFFWYYTPMALKYTFGFNPVNVVYDCMDELSAFKFAPTEIQELEQQLFDRADIVFTGGHSLYEAKRGKHANIHPFPSSIDKAHFMAARNSCQPPADQADIHGFKIGFYGVLDERFDIGLIAEIASQRPEWQIILIGPVVKIDPATLPQSANIHYLGSKTYDQLPLYLSGWDVALIPFLLNESTQFISPTKTPEYLAGGKPVVSTAIRDVVSSYGSNGSVAIGNNAQEFIAIIDQYAAAGVGNGWLEKIDTLLEKNSWDHTFDQMKKLLTASKISPKLVNMPNKLVNEKDLQ
jgi:glycosyltransferase involved in cell wall biosynthesis